MFNKKVIIDSLRNLNKPSKTTNRNSFDFNEPDRTEEGFISAQEGVETPIYKAVRVGPSPIEGKGLFAEQAIKKGDVIGVSHIRQNFTKNGEEYRAPFPSTVLGYYNHSEEPNVYEVDKGDHILMVAGRDIPRGQEITSDYSKHNIEDLEVPEDFKKGGATRRPKMPKGKSPRSYSRSFEATNRLFAEHPLFEKPKSRKNKIFDPRAQYYAKGGITSPEEWEQEIRAVERQIGNPADWTMDDYYLLQDKLNAYRDWRENTPEGQAVIDSHNEEGEYDIPLPEHLQDYTNGMMKAKLAYADMHGNPAAKRMINIPDNPYDFGNGMTGTHYMSSMDNYAVPQIQNVNGQLTLGEFDPSSNEAIKFDNPNDARYFAEHYKEVSPGFIEAELTPEEIEQYAKGGYIVEELPKASRGLPVKTIKDLGRATNITTFGTANTLGKTLAPIMIHPARIPVLGGRIENLGAFTGSPLNAIPFYGKKIESTPNAAFRKFGDTLDFVKMSGELSPAHGPLIRMGKNQIMEEGNWAALNQPNEWYPGVMSAKFDFDAPGTNLGFTKIGGRDGVLITDAQGNRMPNIPISDPGLSFQRRLPFSNRYVDVNMEKLRNNQFDISTVGTNTQALLERYGYGMGYAALLGAMGLSAPKQIIDDYINKPLVEGYSKYIKPGFETMQDVLKPKRYRMTEDGSYEEYSKGGLVKFVSGGTNDCPDGYIKDENGNCIPANYDPSVAKENTEFLKSMANSPLFIERYARMVGKPLEEVTQEAEDYRKQILQNLETVGMGNSAYPPQPYKSGNIDVAAYYLLTPDMDKYSKALNDVQLLINELPNKGKRNKELRASYQTIYDEAKKDYDEKLRTGHKLYFDVNQWDQPTDLHERSHASVKGDLQVAKPYKHKDFSKEQYDFMKEILENRYPEDKKWYYEDADEIKARKDIAAKVMMKLGLYDPVNETFTPEHYKKLRELMGSGKLDIDTERQLQDITRPFTEEETIRMFNDIVQNDYDQDIQYGKYGGQFELGDEVDEVTMKQLIKLGYTFEKI